MATDKLFKVVGVSKHKGEYKVRFANDIMRIKVLDKNGHEDIRLSELEDPLSKLDAVNLIKGLEEFADTAAQCAIDEWLSVHGTKQPSTKAGPAVRACVQESETEVEDLDAPF